jgi:hypothetical protein
VGRRAGRVLTLLEQEGEERNVEHIRSLLVDKGVLFRTW